MQKELSSIYVYEANNLNVRKHRCILHQVELCIILYIFWVHSSLYECTRCHYTFCLKIAIVVSTQKNNKNRFYFWYSTSIPHPLILNLPFQI
jgi:hypothetical protein